MPLGLVCGVSSAYSDNCKITLVGVSMPGVAGLFAGPAAAVFFAFIVAVVVGTATNLGLWLFSRFRTVSIRVVVDPPIAPEKDEAPYQPLSPGGDALSYPATEAENP